VVLRPAQPAFEQALELLERSGEDLLQVAAWCVTAIGCCPAGRASIEQRLSAFPDLPAFTSPKWTSTRLS
jgi:hypothetical protein